MKLLALFTFIFLSVSAYAQRSITITNEALSLMEVKVENVVTNETEKFTLIPYSSVWVSVNPEESVNIFITGLSGYEVCQALNVSSATLSSIFIHPSHMCIFR